MGASVIGPPMGRKTHQGGSKGGAGESKNDGDDGETHGDNFGW
jgi:hypothetical protein